MCGCLPTVYAGKMAVPQVHLTEAEARSVIVAEARKAGIDFEAGGPEIPGADIDAFDSDGKTKTQPLMADGYDPQRGLGYVFVSEEDAAKWSGGPVPARIYGEIVSEAVKAAKADKAFATFRDPHRFNGADEAAKQKSLNEDREKLREQVRDFVKWLKSQGVI
jgi:hypothetical protein